MTEAEALNSITRQVQAAKKELDEYDPPGFEWFERALTTVRLLVPWLVEEASDLQVYVEDVLNSPALLREAWSDLRPQIDMPVKVARIDQLLEHESVLLDFVAGDTVSIVVTGYLLRRFPGNDLASNSKSDYPDVYLKTCDYSRLPIRRRNLGTIGAAVRGKARKPVRVPDGLEIKTSRNRANIDCHYPHVGLHLMLSFSTTSERVVVDDVLVAYLRAADYRIATRRTEATTVKASFSRAAFISLLHKPSD